MKSLWSWLARCVRRLGGGRIEILLNGGLVEYGWFRSRRLNRSVDREGRPIPWITYPALDFLAARVQPAHRVFEYGCGNGTLWWAGHAKEVIAVEHEAGWLELIKRAAPANARLLHRVLEDKSAYAGAIAGCGGAFDIVVIDGRFRSRCAAAATRHLAPGGVMIWDDADRPFYAEGQRALKELGFKELWFRGMKPISKQIACTAIYYRADNVLGI